MPHAIPETRRAYNKAYKEANRERIRALNRASDARLRAADPAGFRANRAAAVKRSRDKDPERVNERARGYYAKADKFKLAAKARRYRKTRPDIQATDRNRLQKWSEDNPEKAKVAAERWSKNNPGKERAKVRRHHQKKMATDLEYRQQQIDRINAWAKANPEKQDAARKAWRQANLELLRAYTAQRRAREAKPAWADRKAIRAFYKACPPGYEVDHIIPLKGTYEGNPVSGLHIVENLQYLPRFNNRTKGGRG